MSPIWVAGMKALSRPKAGIPTTAGVLIVAAATLMACGPSGPSSVTGPMVAGPTMTWLAGQPDIAVEGPLLVVESWSLDVYDGFREGESELREAQPFGITGPFDDASRSAIEAATGELGPAEFVASAAEAQDRSAEEHLGCYPFRGNGTLITLGAPLHPFAPGSEQNRRLLVLAKVERSCGGGAWLLELTWDGSQYQVTPLRVFMFAV